MCASQDLARMDHVMVGNFITAEQAQRKWYTTVLSKISLLFSSVFPYSHAMSRTLQLSLCKIG